MSAPRALAACLATALVAAAPASGQIVLDGDFDHGSLRAYAVTDSPTAPVLDLVGRDNYYGGGEWRWLNFKAAGLAGTTPTFRISDDFAGGSYALNNHAMVYSTDAGASWDFFDNNGRTGRGVYQFSNDAPFASDAVQVAYAVPYSYGMSLAHTRDVLATSWATPTASGDARGVIGRSPGGVDDLGRTIAPRDIFAYRITNPDSDLPKAKVVFTTGMHAGETLGTHTFQGLIDFLVSDDPRAAAVRDGVDVYAYPTMNPDGRFAGYNRSTVENPDRDPNGFWSPGRWRGHEDIAANGEAMIADTRATPGAVDVFVDFHSTIPAFPGDDFGFLEYEQGDDRHPYWLALKGRQPNVLDVDSTSTGPTSANFAEWNLGAGLDVTFETQFGTRRPVEYYHDLGRNFGLALFDTYAVPEPAAGATLFASGLLLRRRRLMSDV